MKITRHYKNHKPRHILNIVKAEYAGKLTLDIFFSDGKSQRVNFADFIVKSGHPSIKKYRNEKKFKSFKIDDGNINWNDYDMIFPVEDLYSGKL